MAQQQQRKPILLPAFPRSIFDYTLGRFPSLWENIENELSDWTQQGQEGLTIYEDKKNVNVEAFLPGLTAKDIEITLDKGILWIKGEKREEEEDKEKKYYRRASNSFSYRVTLPANVDEKSEPKATFKDGILKLIFQKAPQSQAKKITIKGS